MRIAEGFEGWSQLELTGQIVILKLPGDSGFCRRQSGQNPAFRRNVPFARYLGIFCHHISRTSGLWATLLSHEGSCSKSTRKVNRENEELYSRHVGSCSAGRRGFIECADSRKCTEDRKCAETRERADRSEEHT